LPNEATVVRLIFIVRRLGFGLIQLLTLAPIVFFLIRLLPADPVSRLVGLNPTPDAYQAARHALGLDQPLLVQLGNYIGVLGAPGLLQGNLGVSWSTGEPVLADIGRTLPVTIELITLSFLCAFIVSFPIGMLCATRPESLADRATFMFGLFAGSQPEFWWGVLFIYVFFYVLNVAPPPLGRLNPLLHPPAVVTGFITVDSILAWNGHALLDGLHHLMLPVATKVFVLSGPIIKMVRQNMLRVLGSDFMLYAESCGLSRGILARYALRNALPAALTLIGVLYGYVLGGAVLIETIFSLDGIGQYAVNAVLNLDYPSIQGVVLVITAVSLLVYLMLDVAQAAIDPRVAD
jgi:ABC-type dipeptide/oligopeptide/nickel transport system permease component